MPLDHEADRHGLGEATVNHSDERQPPASTEPSGPGGQSFSERRRSTVFELARQEADLLLTNTRLNTAGARWLSGEHVDVMTTPVQGGGSEEVDVLLTVVARAPEPLPLTGAEVTTTDASGRVARYTLNADGHAHLSLRSGSFQVSLAPPERSQSPAVTVSNQRASSLERRPRGSGQRWVFRGAAAAAAVVLVSLAAWGSFLGNTQAVALAPLFKLTCTDVKEIRQQADGTSLVVAAVWADAERDRFREVLQRFSRANPNIDITLATDTPVAHGEKSGERDLGRKLRDTKCPPDVALLPQPGLLHELAEANRIKPIDGVAGDLLLDNYGKGWREQATHDDRFYGVWFKGALKSQIWYNVHAFREIGVTRRDQLPKSFEDLKALAERLQAKGITPFAVAGADGWTLTDWFENVYLRKFGAAQYKRLATHEVPWTDSTVVETLRTLGEIFGREEFLVGGRAGARELTYKESVTEVFGDPQRPGAAMVFEGDFVANEITGETEAEIGESGDAWFFPFPSIGGTSSGTGTQASVAGTSGPTTGGAAAGGDIAVLFNDKSDAARKLIRFLATPEAAEPWVRAGGFISPNGKVDVNWYPEHLRASVRALVSQEAVLFDLSDLQPTDFGGNPDTGMWPILQRFLAEPRPAEEVAQELEDAWQRAQG